MQVLKKVAKLDPGAEMGLVHRLMIRRFFQATPLLSLSKQNRYLSCRKRKIWSILPYPYWWPETWQAYPGEVREAAKTALGMLKPPHGAGMTHWPEPLIKIMQALRRMYRRGDI